MHRLAVVSTVLAGCLLVAGPAARVVAADTTVYQCAGADGRAVFQDSPCPAGQQQRTLAVPDMPSRSPPPAVIRAPPPAGVDAPAPATPEPAAPLPVMYACVRATDGKAYLSENGNPAPYLAPYGVLGAGQQPLSEVYGPDRGAAGMSAPEANRGRVTSDLVANNYVWVQDTCRELDREETCQALQDAYDENARQLRNAFKSQRPPLERREAQLHAQLASCE